mmetsp:Transcript_14277/g.50824  ORF Transcript_14277/g.50824 Transcript_14277/m.50824 type:complete len:276 (-) Transcript_14277:8-835(-)
MAQATARTVRPEVSQRCSPSAATAVGDNTSSPEAIQTPASSLPWNRAAASAAARTASTESSAAVPEASTRGTGSQSAPPLASWAPECSTRIRLPAKTSPSTRSRPRAAQSSSATRSRACSVAPPEPRRCDVAWIFVETEMTRGSPPPRSLSVLLRPLKLHAYASACARVSAVTTMTSHVASAASGPSSAAPPTAGATFNVASSGVATIAASTRCAQRNVLRGASSRAASIFVAVAAVDEAYVSTAKEAPSTGATGAEAPVLTPRCDSAAAAAARR